MITVGESGEGGGEPNELICCKLPLEWSRFGSPFLRDPGGLIFVNMSSASNSESLEGEDAIVDAPVTEVVLRKDKELNDDAALDETPTPVVATEGEKDDREETEACWDDLDREDGERQLDSSDNVGAVPFPGPGPNWVPESTELLKRSGKLGGSGGPFANAGFTGP